MEPKSAPEISVNPLAEYTEASEARRRLIVKDQKYPSKLKIARYRSARDAFTTYFQQGFDKQVLIAAIQRLQSKEPISDWVRDDTKNSIRALRNFLRLEFPFKNLKCRFIKPVITAYPINGVVVTVAPDLLLEWENDGQKYAGAIKFYIKQKALTYQQGHVCASLLADFLGNILSNDVLISKPHCICVDIMNRRIFPASGNTETAMRLASNACGDIRNRWPVI